MRRFLLALSLLFATPCWAQSEEQLFTAGKTIEMVAPSLAQAVIAVELCGVGDAAPWKKVATAIDRRHARCIAQDAGWRKLVEKPDTLVGTFALDSFLNTRGAEALPLQQHIENGALLQAGKFGRASRHVLQSLFLVAGFQSRQNMRRI